jgi:hypothetical protein
MLLFYHGKTIEIPVVIIAMYHQSPQAKFKTHVT